MNWQLSVSLRYLTSKRKEKFISLISIISILGVALGVAALIIVIGVMSGFDNDLKDKIIGTNSHIVVESDYGIAPSDDLLNTVTGTEHVMAASFYLSGQALIRRDDNVTGVMVRGIVPGREREVTKIASYITAGSLDFGQDGVVIGSELAQKLNLHVGDEVSMVSPAFVKGKAFKVYGIFTSGMYDYDANLVYLDLAKAQEFFASKDLATGIAVKVDDAFNVGVVKLGLQRQLGRIGSVRTWMEHNKNLLAALKLEKTVMFLILTLIVMVACFNIASTLIMTVLEKTKDIGILKAIGASSSDVMAVFAMQGGLIGFIGTALGTGMGVLLAWLLKTYQFVKLPKDIYYIDRLPVRLEMHDILIIVLSSLLISLVATIYPSYQASRLDPVEALRYE